jgi:hypothetical protein
MLSPSAKRDAIRADELAADDERLREAFRLGLRGVLNLQPRSLPSPSRR